jgi:hypothetical protein
MKKAWVFIFCCTVGAFVYEIFERPQSTRTLSSIAKIGNLNDLLAYTSSSQGPESVEDVLSQLSTDLLKYYSLIRESRSLQESSPQNPRVVLFGQDAKFILAFNGDPKEKGYNTLEAIQFTPGKTFEFREIEFIKGKKPQISEANPIKCMQCHGIQLTPLMDSYPVWRGFFGAYDDELNSNEMREVKLFNNLRMQHDRYKYLQDQEASNYVKSFDARPYRLDQKDQNIKVRPNFALMFHIGALKAQYAFNEMKQSPFFAQLFNTITYENYTYCKDNDEVKSVIKKYAARARSYHPVYLEEDSPLYSLDLFNVTDGFFREPTYDGFGVNSINYAGYNSKGNSHLLTWLVQEQKRMGFLPEQFFIPNKYTSLYEGFYRVDRFPNSRPKTEAILKNELCDILKAKAVTELQVVSNLTTDQFSKTVSFNGFTFSKNAPQYTHSCIVCHTGNRRTGPEIPFDDPSKLALKIQSDPVFYKTLISRIKLPTSNPLHMPKVDREFYDGYALKDYLKDYFKDLKDSK